jgi:hypothetical protein
MADFTFRPSYAQSCPNIFFNFPLYLQSVPIHSANAVKSYTKACRRVLTSTLLYLIGSESSCDLGSVTYKINLKNYIYNYSIYILNLVGRSTGKFFRNRLVSGGSWRFKISSFGCTPRRFLYGGGDEKSRLPVIFALALVIVMLSLRVEIIMSGNTLLCTLIIYTCIFL